MKNACILPTAVKNIKKQLLNKEISPDDIAKMLPEDRAALKSILEDFVADKQGIKITAKEQKFIDEQSAKIEKIQETLGTDMGNPIKSKENVEYWVEKKKMDDFMLSQRPSPALRVLTGTIGRAVMLFSVKSPVLNIGSNLEVGITEAISRRIARGQWTRSNSDLVKSYIKMNREIYKKTGYDMSRMMGMSDTGGGGSRLLDDIVHTQGTGKIHKVGQVAEDIVFKQMMGRPDAEFGAWNFVDSVSLGAKKMAGGNAKIERELLADAMRVEPRTVQGSILKSQGVLDAQVATWTNDSWATAVTQGIRGILNGATGDLRLGDYLLPFVKTSANVISTGMDYAGVGVLKAFGKAIGAIRSGGKDALLNQHNLTGMFRDLTRAGLGMTAAAVLANNIKVEDYVGAYDPDRQQIEELKNSTSNSVKINGKWVSTDWLGPLSVPFNAMMYAKKYSKDKKTMDKVVAYANGVGSSVLQLPGVSDVAGWVKQSNYAKQQTAGESGAVMTAYAIDQASSRLMPSIINDIAKGTDPYQRKGTSGDPIGAAVESLQAKIPGWRQGVSELGIKGLPVKTSVLGEPLKGESFLQTILFGSRVKTASNDETIKEMDRVTKAVGKAASFTDWDKSSSQTLAQFKTKVGNDTYNKAKVEYGQQLKSTLDKLIKTDAYKNASEEDKLSTIYDADSKVQSDVLKRYSFKYKSTTKTSSQGALLNALNSVVK